MQRSVLGQRVAVMLDHLHPVDFDKAGVQALVQLVQGQIVHKLNGLPASCRVRVSCALEGSNVAQIFNLPYRRIVFGSAAERFHTSALHNAWQSRTLRYGTTR